MIIIFVDACLRCQTDNKQEECVGEGYCIKLCSLQAAPSPNIAQYVTVYCFLLAVKEFHSFHGLLRDRESF